LATCIAACIECAQACTACADACLSEPTATELTKCIRTDLDCADISETTGRVLSRHTGYDANLTRTVLESCATACRSCAEECERHSDAHAHCRICAEGGRRCESACRELLSALGWVPLPSRWAAVSSTIRSPRLPVPGHRSRPTLPSSGEFAAQQR